MSANYNDLGVFIYLGLYFDTNRIRKMKIFTLKNIVLFYRNKYWHFRIGMKWIRKMLNNCRTKEPREFLLPSSNTGKYCLRG